MKVGYSFEGLVKKILEIDESAVHKTGDEAIAGLKTFSSCPATSAAQGTTGNHLIKKSFFDTELGKKFDKTGGNITARTTIVLPAGTSGLPNDTNGNANNYNNKAILAAAVGNSALHIFGDDRDTSNTLALQSGSSDPAATKTVGTLLLNPYGGEVVIGHLNPKKGALQLRDGASLKLYDGSSAQFHAYAKASSIVVGHGTNAEYDILTINQTGLTINGTGGLTSGGIVSAIGYVDVSDRGGATQIRLNTPSNADPYLSAKAYGNSSANNLVTFGKTETLFNARVTADTFRVVTDAGLKFAPVGDLSGVTWGLGINATTRNLGFHKYEAGVWKAAPLQLDGVGVVLTGRVSVNGPLLVFSNIIRLESGSSNILEFHQPGVVANMIFQPVGQSAIRISASNGAGAEGANYAMFNGDGLYLNGRVIATYPAANRAWGEIGKNAFHLNQIMIGPGAFVGVLGEYLHNSGKWAAEFGYGVYTSDDINTTGHVLNCTDGANYHRFWQFRNDGELINPVGGGLHGGGIPFGTSFGAYGDMVTWASASFSLQSHKHDAQVGNWNVVQGQHSTIGSYIFAALHPVHGGPFNPGNLVPGTSLYPAACAEWSQNRGWTFSGTWMCMGFVDANTDDRWDDRATLWFRVA